MTRDTHFPRQTLSTAIVLLGLWAPTAGHAAPDTPKHPVLVGTELAAAHFQKGEFASAVAELEKALAKARASTVRARVVLASSW